MYCCMQCYLKNEVLSAQALLTHDPSSIVTRCDTGVTVVVAPEFLGFLDPDNPFNRVVE